MMGHATLAHAHRMISRKLKQAIYDTFPIRDCKQFIDLESKQKMH